MTVTIDTEITPRIVTKHFADARRAAGLTQHELAERLGWSRSMIALVETGRRSLNNEQAAWAAELLDRYRKSRIKRREEIGQMLESMPLSREQLAMLHGGG